jgi:hypothetical protein
MIVVRRALQRDPTKLGCHTFRLTGITVYLLNGGLLGHPKGLSLTAASKAAGFLGDAQQLPRQGGPGEMV